MEPEIETQTPEKPVKAFSVAVLRVFSCAMIIVLVVYLKFYNVPIYERFCNIYQSNESEEIVSAEEFSDIIKQCIANLKN